MYCKCEACLIRDRGGIKRTSRRVIYRHNGESGKLIATFKLDSDALQLAKNKNEYLLDHLFAMAEIASIGSGGPGKFFANPPHVTIGNNGRIAVIQTGGLDV